MRAAIIFLCGVLVGMALFAAFTIAGELAAVAR